MTAWRSRSRSATSRRSRWRWTAWSRSTGSARSATTWPSAATSTRSSRSSGRPAVRPGARARTSSPPGWRSWRRSTTQAEPVHPDDPEIRGCHHVQFLAPGSDARHSRHAMAIYPGWFDRSPCGTGTRRGWRSCTRAASCGLDDGLHQRVVHRHPLHRPPRRARRPSAGFRPSIPTITGRAWITGTAQYLLDPDDPFPAGFLL